MQSFSEQSYSELELTVGDTIYIGDHTTLTLLDTEDGLALFQVDADDEYRLLEGEELYEILAGAGSELTMRPR